MIITILLKIGWTLLSILTSLLIAKSRDGADSKFKGLFEALTRTIAALDKVPKGIGKICVAPFVYTIRLATNAPDTTGSRPNILETLNRRAGDAHSTIPKIITSAQSRIT